MLLGACSGTPGAEQIISQPESVQRQALMACQAEQGVNIPEALNVLRLSDGRVIVSAVNGPGLSLSQARAINQCGQARLLGTQIPAQQGYVEVPVAQPAQSYPSQTAASRAVPHQPAGAPFGCVESGGVLQGGSAICPGN